MLLQAALGDAQVTPVAGEFLAPILKRIPYDALTIGNHELYEDSTVENLESSGFLQQFGERLVTSNQRLALDGHPIGGSQHTVLEGRNGARLLAFGFLFNFQSTGPATLVAPTEARCTAPPAQTTGVVTVDVTNLAGGFTTSAKTFTYVQMPQVLSISPQSGDVAGGTEVIVAGKHFVENIRITCGWGPLVRGASAGDERARFSIVTAATAQSNTAEEFVNKPSQRPQPIEGQPPGVTSQRTHYCHDRRTVTLRVSLPLINKDSSPSPGRVAGVRCSSTYFVAGTSVIAPARR